MGVSDGSRRGSSIVHPHPRNPGYAPAGKEAKRPLVHVHAGLCIQNSIHSIITCNSSLSGNDHQ